MGARIRSAPALIALVVSTTLLAFGVVGSASAAQTTIDFESISGPTTFCSSPRPPTLGSPLAIGIATFTGGAVLNAASFLPADPSSVYGTAQGPSFGVSCPTYGYQSTIGIAFSKPVHGFSLLLVNGNPATITYTVQSPSGGSVTKTLVGNAGSGHDTFAIPGGGITSVSVAPTTPATQWDFFIDNVQFTPDLTMTTTASPSGTLGTPVTDTATLAEGTSPTGSITFRLYGPNDPTCSSAPVATSTVTVNGDGNYTSAPAAPFFPGTYRWLAAYSGDANNAAIVSPCGAANEQITLGTTKASPSLTTHASPDVPFGGSISDTATLSGGNNPTGTITFKLYGPLDNNCTNAPVTTLTVSVSASPAPVPSRNFGSGSYTPTNIGIFRWVASYSGDANNNAVATACNATNEAVYLGPIPILD